MGHCQIYVYEILIQILSGVSVVVAIARDLFLRAERGRKPQICRWNCHPICHSSRDISISGFDDHIAISGCRLLTQSLGDILFGHAMIENTGLAVGISTVSVVVPVVLLFPVLVAIWLLSVVVRCYSHLLTLSASSPWSKTPGLPSEL